MRIPIRIPIAVKMIGIIVGLITAVAVVISLRTNDIIQDKLKDREIDSTAESAQSVVREVDAIIEKVSEKAKMIGILLLKQNVNPGDANSEIGDILRIAFDSDPDMVAVTLYKRSGSKIASVEKMVNDAYFKKYKLGPNYLARLQKKRPAPLFKMFTGEVLVKNRSLEQGAPLLTLAMPLRKSKAGRVTFGIVADFKISVIQSPFAKPGVVNKFLVDGLGDLLGHSQEELVLRAASLADNKMVKSSLDAQMNQGSQRYFDKEREDFFIANFAKSKFGLTVIAETAESVALGPARAAQLEAKFISAITIFGSLCLVVFFSWTLSNPIKKLVVLTRKIATGDFDVLATKVVRSNDEVGTLAASFDAMVGGLKERDRVKNLFNKFHGSSVTESLMHSDNVGVGGARQQVAVFFSDIRGFTSLSEKTSPEEVVTMLNEYFSKMVEIIHRNNGIVDKFIGDAIMAVWGAPKSTGHDAYYVVRACLEMRVALHYLNQDRIARGDEPLMIGMGVHMGDAISGTIGSDEKLEWTVIGDTVNMAARIEASTKAFGTDLLVSEEVAHQIKDYYIFQEVGAAEVKGKSKPLKLFRTLGFYDEQGGEKIITTAYSEFEKADADKVKIVS